MGCYGLRSSGSGQGQLEGSYEHRNEPSSFIKCWGILEWLIDWAASQEELSSMELFTYDY
jgi:hypothetical protein